MLKTENKVICFRCQREWVPNFSLDAFEIDGVTLCELCAMPIMMKLGNPEPIDDARAKNVCKRGQEADTCAFLVMSPSFACAKHSSFHHILQDRLDKGMMGAKGDTCSGPPVFKVLARRKSRSLKKR